MTLTKPKPVGFWRALMCSHPTMSFVRNVWSAKESTSSSSIWQCDKCMKFLTKPGFHNLPRP